jgi:Domain of unknown function (DUF4118)
MRDGAPTTTETFWVAIGGLAPIAAGAALVGVRDVVDNANVVLVLVLVVVAVAAAGGRWAGAIAALTSALSFDFFHTRPYLSLSIASRDDVETTVLLLVIGFLVGHLAFVAARRATLAQAGQREVSRLYRVVEQAAAGTAPEDVLTAVRAELGDLLGLRDCRWESGAPPADLPVLLSTGWLEADTLHRFREDGFELPEGGFALPVRANGAVLGHLDCVPSGFRGVSLEQRRVAVALADELGLALAAGGRGYSGSAPQAK